jgi:hypothetical protein
LLVDADDKAMDGPIPFTPPFWGWMQEFNVIRRVCFVVQARVHAKRGNTLSRDKTIESSNAGIGPARTTGDVTYEEGFTVVQLGTWMVLNVIDRRGRDGRRKVDAVANLQIGHAPREKVAKQVSDEREDSNCRPYREPLYDCQRERNHRVFLSPTAA